MRARAEEKTLKKLKIAATVSILITVLTAVGVFCFLFVDFEKERELIEIPELVGRRFDEIREIENIRIESEPIFFDEVPEGEVISQTPYGGAKRKLAEGERYTVRLTVSMGRETKSIPMLEGYKYTEAAASLRSMDAKIRIVSIYDDKIERDIVLRTSPTAGEKIARGETVTLFVSRKHIQAPICVGDLIGMNKEEAVISLLEQGLALGEIGVEKNENYPTGTVVSQSISPGSYVLYGTKIDIKISAEEDQEELHPFRKDMFRKTENCVKATSFLQ